MSGEVQDLIVIGAGINGAGIAIDLASRGLNVTLIDKDDIASETSEASSKLIHGGLRYLEHYEFRLVKEALAEREVLLKLFPQLVSPLRFALPHQDHLRPRWMLRAGLFLYDHLSTLVTLPKSRAMKFDASILKPHLTDGFVYSDCAVDDARLVLTCAKALVKESDKNKVLTRHKVESAKYEDNTWHVVVQDLASNTKKTLKSKALVNATGPWVLDIYDNALKEKAPHHLRLVRGSHIIVKGHAPHAFLLQNEDARIVFVIPYLDEFLLIGTTDVEQKDPDTCKMSEEERDYLIEIFNKYFNRQLGPNDVVHSFAGLRALYNDGSGLAQKASRDYKLELDARGLLSVFGGKITTYRKLAQHAGDMMSAYFAGKGQKLGPCRTDKILYPGSDTQDKNAQEYAKFLRGQYEFLPENLALRLARGYGSEAVDILETAKSLDDLGEDLCKESGMHFHEKELAFMKEREFAKSLEDVIWRRSKLGLYISEVEKERISKKL